MPIEALHKIQGFLQAVEPFDFTHALRFLRQFSPAQGAQTMTAQTLTRAVRVGEEPVAFRAQAAEGGIGYAIYSARPLTLTQQQAVVDRIRFFLSLDDDLQPFYELARTDELFWSVARRWYGYHQVKFITPFAAAAWAIFSARNRRESALAIQQRLQDAYGDTLLAGGERFEVFPSAQVLRAANPDRLAKLAGGRRRSEYLTRAAAVFADADEQWLRHGSYDAVRDWLMAVKGIGPWAAELVLIRGLGRMERLQVPERLLLAAATRVYEQPLDEEGVLALASRYGPYQAYWAHYLRADAEPAL